MDQANTEASAPAGRALWDRPAPFAAFLRELAQTGRRAEALRLAASARAARPDDPLLRAIAGRAMRDKVPSYHARMLRDHARNAAYARAIAAAAPGRRVLDIGTGSGLLALLAARAGASHVYACEADPALAATAAQIVAANGLADRITVLAKPSARLDRANDLGGGVDLVVSEVFSQDVIGEGVLQTLAHARAHLCLPGARFLPEAAAVRVALADFAVDRPAFGDVEGFDLSLFERHCKPGSSHAPDAGAIALRSDPADLFAFDFAKGPPLDGSATLALAAHGGPVAGIAQWLRIEFGDGSSYENAPGTPGAHWKIGCTPLPEPRDTAPGEAIAVHGWYGVRTLAIWAEA